MKNRNDSARAAGRPARPGGKRGDGKAAGIVAAVLITLLFMVLLFGRKLGLPSDLISLFVRNSAPQVEPGSWRTLRSEGGRFLVEMPGEPSQETMSDVVAGAPRSLTVYTVQVPEKYAFLVTFGDLRDHREGLAADELLALARDAAVRQEQGRLVSDAPLTLGMVPGREVTISGSGGMVRARFYVRDAALYSLQVRSTKAFVRSGDAERFFGSFNFLESAALTDPGASEWRELAPVDGRFSVQMPGLASQEQETVTMKAGDTVLYSFHVRRGGPAERYTVQYMDYPGQLLQDPRAAEEALKKAATVDAYNINGTVVSERAIALDRYPGREVQVRNADMEMRVRLYLVDQRLYKTIAAWPKSRPFSADDERFLGSFRLRQ